jgi:hypothetical protein
MHIHGLREARPPPTTSIPNDERSAVSEPTRTDEPSPFARLVSSLGKEVNAGERTMSQALHGGGSLGPSELLALQAGVYRYSEAVDLAAKLVDRASTGVKTVVQGQ